MSASFDLQEGQPFMRADKPTFISRRGHPDFELPENAVIRIATTGGRAVVVVTSGALSTAVPGTVHESDDRLSIRLAADADVPSTLFTTIGEIGRFGPEEHP